MQNNSQHIYYILIALFIALCTISTTLAMADGTLLSNLQKLKISPDIISASGYIATIKVELHGNIVKPGDPVPAKNFKDLNMAKISWEADFEGRYTLLLLDLDRKSASNLSNNNTQGNIYNQFTSLNIPGNVINAGQTIVAFDTPSVECQPSMKHRILMLAYQQDQNIDISDVAYMSASSGQSKKRENFNLSQFAERHRLTLAAANVFLALGETNGVCSGSDSTMLLQHNVLPSILIAMVMTLIAVNNFSTRRLIF